MDWLTWIFLENAYALSAACGTALFILLVLWRRGGSPRPLLIGLALTALLFAVQTFVTTPREHALQALRAIERDLRAGRSDALAGWLAPEFDAGRFAGEPLNRSSFLALVDRQLAQTRVRELYRTSLSVERESPERFTASVAYLAEIVRGQMGGSFRSRWELTFDRTPRGWRITHIQPRFVDGLPSATWDAIDRN